MPVRRVVTEVSSPGVIGSGRQGREVGLGAINRSRLLLVCGLLPFFPNPAGRSWNLEDKKTPDREIHPSKSPSGKERKRGEEEREGERGFDREPGEREQGGKMKGCELCERAARMYCESDQASLCWECDAKVHGANFLVARHSRCLLCRNCQAPTPWRASGARLGPTVSVCERCCLQGKHWREDVGDDDGISQEAEVDEGDDLMEEDEGEEEVEGEGEGEGGAEDDDEEEEEDGDNQVVPWSLTPPPVASSSSSDESSSRIYNGYLKRVWENADLASRVP